MNHLVSIIIPCYNAQSWIASTIDSAIAQTWTNTEIIVVDDGSTDESLAIARSYESANIKVISQQNKGASAARNCGLKVAQGDFIQYLDADDLLAPDKIERQLATLERSPGETVASGKWSRFYNSIGEACFEFEPLWKDLSPIDWLICAWLGNWMMHPAAWLIPSSIIEKAGEWNENLTLNDDGEYFCRVVLASEEVRFCAEAKSYYRSGLFESLSNTQSDEAYLSAFTSIDLCAKALLTKEDSTKTRHAAATLFQRFIYESYPQVKTLRTAASKRVKELGGSSLSIGGSPSFLTLSNLVGWQNSKCLQRLIYNLGYRRLLVNQEKQKSKVKFTSS